MRVATDVLLEGKGLIRLSQADHVATGGEGSVYRKNNFAIKIYTDPKKMLQDNMVDKVKLLSAIKHPSIVAPVGLVFNKSQKPIGYFMPYVSGEPLPRFFTNDFRASVLFGNDQANLLAEEMRSVDNPGILSKQIYYTPTSHSEEAYRAKDNLPAGYYSVNDMIEYMIKYSDNDALASLATYDDNHTAEIFNLFELPVPTSATTTDYMSARTYSRIFRVLYDSTYLPWDLSENALRLLSTTDFKVGLVAGVPEGTVVSHKFGERTIPSTDGKPAVRELHDCGIVYKVNKPYFLCVMTRGTDFTKLQTIISDISRSTYSQI
jgi:hypothetical protein